MGIERLVKIGPATCAIATHAGWIVIDPGSRIGDTPDANDAALFDAISTLVGETDTPLLATVSTRSDRHAPERIRILKRDYPETVNRGLTRHIALDDFARTDGKKTIAGLTVIAEPIHGAISPEGVTDPESMIVMFPDDGLLFTGALLFAGVGRDYVAPDAGMVIPPCADARAIADQLHALNLDAYRAVITADGAILTRDQAVGYIATAENIFARIRTLAARIIAGHPDMKQEYVTHYVYDAISMERTISREMIIARKTVRVSSTSADTLFSRFDLPVIQAIVEDEWRIAAALPTLPEPEISGAGATAAQDYQPPSDVLLREAVDFRDRLEADTIVPPYPVRLVRDDPDSSPALMDSDASRADQLEPMALADFETPLRLPDDIESMTGSEPIDGVAATEQTSAMSGADFELESDTDSGSDSSALERIDDDVATQDAGTDDDALDAFDDSAPTKLDIQPLTYEDLEREAAETINAWDGNDDDQDEPDTTSEELVDDEPDTDVDDIDDAELVDAEPVFDDDAPLIAGHDAIPAHAEQSRDGDAGDDVEAHEEDEAEEDDDEYEYIDDDEDEIDDDEWEYEYVYENEDEDAADDGGEYEEVEVKEGDVDEEKVEQEQAAADEFELDEDMEPIDIHDDADAVHHLLADEDLIGVDPSSSAHIAVIDENVDIDAPESPVAVEPPAADESAKKPAKKSVASRPPLRRPRRTSGRGSRSARRPLPARSVPDQIDDDEELVDIGETPAVAPPPAPVVLTKIEPGVGTADIRIGMSRKKLLDSLKNEWQEKTQLRDGTEEYAFPARGIIARVGSSGKSKVVRELIFTVNPSRDEIEENRIKPFPGETSGNVNAACSRKDILHAFGAPENADAEEYLLYPSQGIAFHMYPYRLTSLWEIIVSAPVAPDKPSPEKPSKKKSASTKKKTAKPSSTKTRKRSGKK